MANSSALNELCDQGSTEFFMRANSSNRMSGRNIQATLDEGADGNPHA